MAEKERFELSMEFYPHTRLAGERLQPLGHFSANKSNKKNKNFKVV